ncbi:hypothetical protein [Mycolicibacterium wolinskyi]|uniref:hypothetical protein n=1 Tax=Mycolicibacterium wolinskyi TaxID=59750 RepID=UPI003917A1BC
MSIAMIALTHPPGDGPPDHRAYTGRVLLDAAQICAIEEVKIARQPAISFVTLRNGCAYRVTETPEQILEWMGQALNLAAGEWSGEFRVSDPAIAADYLQARLECQARPVIPKGL